MPSGSDEQGLVVEPPCNYESPMQVHRQANRLSKVMDVMSPGSKPQAYVPGEGGLKINIKGQSGIDLVGFNA